MQNSHQTSDQATELQVEGTIVYTAEIREPSGPKQIKHSRHFIVARKGQQWKIRTTNLDQDDRFGYGNEYSEMGCDGVRIFELKSADENNPRLSGVADIITAQGRVRLGCSPVSFDLDFFYPLWLAYCSADHFRALKDNRIAAPLFITTDSFLNAVPATLVLPVKWKLNESNFVSEINWQSEGSFLYEDDGPSRLEKYPPPFDVGFLQAKFETTDWIRFSEMLLPNSFVLNVFAPDWPKEGEAKCVISFAVEANVQAVHPLQSFSFLPELTKKTRIADTRYRLDSPCSGHPSYAGLAWMTENEVEAKNKSLGIKYEKQTLQS
jgi:hypothetical protein